MQTVKPQYETVRSRVEAYVAAKRRVATGEGAARCGTLLLLVAAALVALAALLAPPAWLRVLLLTTGIVVTLLTAVRWLLVPLARRMDQSHEAAVVEQAMDWPHNPVVGALQLYEEASTKPVGYSLPMARQQVRLGAEMVEGEDLSQLISRRTLKRQACVLAAFLIICGVGAGLWWAHVRAAAISLTGSYSELWQQLFPLEYTILPEDKVILRGDPVALELRFTKPTRRNIRLMVQPEEAEARAEILVSQGVAYSRLLEKPASSFDYWFVIGNTPTRSHRITVTDRPAILSMELDLLYPPYTRLGHTTLRRPPDAKDPLKALVGTTVRLSLAANKPLKDGHIVLGGPTPTANSLRRPPGAIDVNISGRYLATSFKVKESTKLHVSLVCIHKYLMAAPTAIPITAIPDRDPQVKVRVKGNEVFVTEKELETFGFGVEANDDYGIQRLVCRYRIASIPGMDTVREPRDGETSKSYRTANTVVKDAFGEVLRGVDITYGERATIWVEAEDNCQPTPNTGRSKPFHVVLHRPDLGKFVDEKELGWFAKYGAAFGKRNEALLMPPGLSRKETGVSSEKFKVKAAPRKDVWSVEYGEITKSYFQVMAEEMRD